MPVRKVAPARAPAAAARPNPYVDFWWRFTAEGGVEFTYKDIDDRWRWTILRWTLWVAAMAAATWFAFTLSPIRLPVINMLLLGVMGAGCWLVVMKPVEVYRHLEIRPDAMILERSDVFFRHELELAWPQFVADADGNLVFRGISGTRAVDYLTVRRFDEHDRMPEVLAAHVRDAMQQLWSTPVGS